MNTSMSMRRSRTIMRIGTASIIGMCMARTILLASHMPIGTSTRT